MSCHGTEPQFIREDEVIPRCGELRFLANESARMHVPPQPAEELELHLNC